MKRLYLAVSYLKSHVRWLRKEDGVTAIEYGLLAALIALVLAIGAGILGVGLNGIFSAIGGYVTGKAADVQSLP